ncbi:MAG: hypothetical protein AMXMBFR23_15810 [Chloroflexota bacterium]
MNRGRQRDLEAPLTPLERLEERLSAYLDGELTDVERSAVEAELAASAEARETLDDLRLVRSALATLDEGVRAPRSFALTAAPAPARPLALMRRLELFVRAGAAGAALLFVVAVVHEPSSLSTGGAVADTSVAMTAMEAAPAGAELRAGDAAAKGAAPEIAPSEGTPEAVQPAFAPAPASDASLLPPTSGGGAGEGGVMGAAGADGGMGGGEDDGAPTAAGAMPAPESGDLLFSSTSAEGGDASGTNIAVDTSQGVGGVAPALAALAVLLGALSALMTWSRRGDRSAQ